MSPIVRSLVAAIAGVLVMPLLGPVTAAEAAPPHRQDMHKVFVRCHGPQAADAVWIDNQNRVAFASSSYPGNQEINRVVRAGACVAISVGDRGMRKALDRMVNRLSNRRHRSTVFNNGVRVTIMITRNVRIGWDISYLRR